MSSCLTDSALDLYFDHGIGSLDHGHLDRCEYCLDRTTERARSAARLNHAQNGSSASDDLEALPAAESHWIGGRLGRYQLLVCENIGSFGEVWLAQKDGIPADRVAVKLLHQSLAAAPAIRQRFEQERWALQTLSAHPNIVGLRDAGEHEGRPFLVTEYLDGPSLQEYLSAQRRTGCRPGHGIVRDIFFQLCEAAGAAHRCKNPGPLLHRDIKPSNVMLVAQSDGRFRVKLIDFGLVQLGARNGTRTGQRLGTPAYMAPEQALGIIDRQKPWTDVFALVALLLELLTLDSFARRGSQLWELSLRGPSALRKALAAANPQLPNKLWKVIERALSEDGGSRYSDALLLATAVRDAWPES